MKEIFYTLFNHFAKLYDRLRIYQICLPTAVRHGSHCGPRCLQPNRRGPHDWWPATAARLNHHGPQGLGPTAVAHGDWGHFFIKLYQI
jgi:hypothetical protein